MNQKIKFVWCDQTKKSYLSDCSAFAPQQAAKALAFHSSFPEYCPTPLAGLTHLSEALGVAQIYVKDESYRFGLNAFKVLGGSYCIGNYIAKRVGVDISDLSYKKITDPALKKQLGDITFVTATDGNHGRGIAWTANRLGQKSVVYMPKGSASERLNNIRALGADASITSLNYDDTVRLASAHADQYGWVLVQDTSWPDYEEIPTWIMQGYTTMAYEAVEQLAGEKPSHIFLQAGVGAMSGAVAGFFSSLYKGQERPIITIVEPDNANCIYQTAKAGDGNLHTVDGDLSTIMAGLACGEPCGVGWKILQDHADCYVSVPDYIAANGMRILGNPMGNDPRVISGESGAVTLGVVAEVLRNPAYNELKKQLKLDENSKILCFSTEGDTDRENYRRIVWDGKFFEA